MQKSGLILVISGSLIAIGLVLLALGNQVILDEIIQGNGKTGINQDVIISADFNSQETSIGIFAVQIIGVEENIISAKVLDRSTFFLSQHIFSIWERFHIMFADTGRSFFVWHDLTVYIKDKLSDHLAQLRKTGCEIITVN